MLLGRGRKHRQFNHRHRTEMRLSFEQGRILKREFAAMLFDYFPDDRQAKARLLLELAKLATASVESNTAFLVADLAEEALKQSGLESHEHKVKCPKCGGTNVLQLKEIRREKVDRVPWPTSRK